MTRVKFPSKKPFELTQNLHWTSIYPVLKIPAASSFISRKFVLQTIAEDNKKLFLP